ncbi:hypothetical protein FRC09_003131 [Ceratobasidium sp. 395]|nr:hypothetical protein FRC09_003131 [Ceratobasidium sp. 395]
MVSPLALDALPSELQLCVLQHFSTRSLLIYVTRLSKHWFALASELVRQRAVYVLSRPGASVTFETSNPSDWTTRTTYTLQPLPALIERTTGLFESTLECASSFRLPRLSLGFSSAAPTFDFALDEDEYFGSLLWCVYLSTQRSVQCRVSPPASPRLVAFDRTVRHDQRVVEGLERFRRSEFGAGGCEEGEGERERELEGERGPIVYLSAKLEGDREGEKERGRSGRVVSVDGTERSVFKVGFQSVRLDAASVVIASEEGSRGNDMTVLFCGR